MLSRFHVASQHENVFIFEKGLRRFQPFSALSVNQLNRVVIVPMQFVFAGHTHYAHLRGWERQVTVHLFVRVCPVLLLHHFLEISIFTKCYFDSLVCD